MDYGVYCGVDFHARQQTISCLTTEDGVVSSHELKHQNKAALKAFYAQLRGPVLWPWKPVVIAPGLNKCSKNWAMKSGWVTRPRSAGARGGARRTIAVMPS